MPTTIKAKTEDEASLAILLHQAKKSEQQLAVALVRAVAKNNRLTAERVQYGKDLEQMRNRAHIAERELREIKALKYSSRKKRAGVDGVNA